MSLPSPLPYQILGSPKRLDHLPLVAQVLENLQVAQIIDDRIPPHPDRDLSTGTCVEALVLCILLGSHTLYRVSETLEPFDLELLFEQLIDCHQLSDDRLGRALDCLFEAGLSEINTALLMSALEVYELNTKLE